MQQQQKETFTHPKDKSLCPIFLLFPNILGVEFSTKSKIKQMKMRMKRKKRDRNLPNCFFFKQFISIQEILENGVIKKIKLAVGATIVNV